MTLVALLYGALVYLVFFKFRWLPWNKPSQLGSLVIGITILSGFLVGLENLTPASTQAVIMGRVVDIAPQVGGVVAWNAPPQMNRILVVSTCTNSCCGCLRPPFGGTFATVPSMIFNSAC